MPHSTSSTSSSDDPLVGRVLDGRYRIVEKVAAGGMGKVYRAVQEPLGRTVAIKILSLDPRDAAADTFRQRFFREASICARLKHPNTVRIHDYGQTKDDVYYIAMEFLDGQTLRDAMTPGSPMDPVRAIDLMGQICASLSEAHSLGLIHRDLKPSNIILTQHADGKEYVNVVDFGLVKDVENSLDGPTATETGMIVGSPSYMSPEQILQQDLTPRSDIYSLGVLLYVMLTGRKPFRQESLAAVIHRHLNAPPPSFAKINPTASIPPNLEWVTMTCLSKDPDGRFESAGELARALQACALEVTGRYSSIDMSIANGQLILPESLSGALGNSRVTQSRSQTRSRNSLTQPTLARVNEPSTTRARPLWWMLFLGGPTAIGIMVLLMIGLTVGIGGTLFAMGVFSSDPQTVTLETPDPRPTQPTPPAPQPAPEPVKPAPAPEPAPPPRPPVRPTPAPVRPVPAPVIPTPAPPTPAPVPVAAPEPAPTPQPADDWTNGSNTDLADPWED